MRPILISVICFLFPFAMTGCVGRAVPQPPGLEIPASPGFFVVHPQGLFFVPMALALKEGADGVVTVQAATGPASLPPFSDPVSDSGLAQLNGALLPFLFPSCDVVSFGRVPR